MANNQNTVQLIIEGNNVVAIKAIDGTVTKLSQLGNKAKETQGPIDKLSSALGLTASQFTVGAAVAGLSLMIKNAIEAGDKFNDMSAKTGIAVETLSLLDYTAQLNGTTIENVSNAIVKFNRNIYDAASGTGEAIPALKSLNITLEDQNGNLKDSETLLLEVSKKFSSMENGIQKTAIAQKFFGKSGAESIQMLNDLGKNGEQYKKFLKDTGALITTEFAQAADRFNDNLAAMQTAMRGVGIQLANDLLPSMTAASSVLVQVSSSTDNALPLISLLSIGLKSVATAFGGVMVGAIVAGEALGTYSAAMAKAASLDFSGAAIAVRYGFDQIKTTALQAGQVFDSLWNPSKFQAQIDAMSAVAQIENDNIKNKQRGEQWLSTQQRLNNEMIVLGMDEQSKKIITLINQATDYKQKFGEIPGALATIDKWFEKLVNAQAPIKAIDIPIRYSIPYTNEGVTFAQKQAGLFGEAFYNQLSLNSQRFKESGALKDMLHLTPELDLTKFLAAKEMLSAAVSDISANSMLHFTLMQDGVSNIFGNMAGAAENAYIAMGEKSRLFFDVYKAMSIAQASIDTYQSAVAAYKAMVGIPIVGPGLAVAAAAAATAFGLSNIARIASLQPGSRAGSPTVSNGAYSIPSARSYNTNTVTNNTSKNQNININITTNGNGDVDKYVRDELAPALKKAISDGVIDL